MARFAAILLAAFLAWSTATSAAQAVPVWRTLPMEHPLPPLTRQGYVEHDGARIWFGTVGAGKPVILLHGGLSSSLAWGGQVPALLESHHRVILIDSRGHGRSTLGPYALSYERMQADVLAVMDALHLRKASFVGWSDGAIISLIAAMKHPERVDAVYAFGANMNTDGIVPGIFDSPLLAEMGTRLAREYADRSGDPAGFRALHQAVEAMQRSEPKYTTEQLAAIRGPRIAIADAEHEEFITRAHTEYLATAIPSARLVILPDLSHFAPWQDPGKFNRSMVDFLDAPRPARPE